MMRRVQRTTIEAEKNEPVTFDPQRRTELLAEARRKRVAWVEEARGVNEGVHGARRRRESEAIAISRKAEGELERLFPSAVKFHDFLSGLAGDEEESPAGDLSAILQPFLVQNIDIGDDRPIPAHRPGVNAFDTFLDKLRHPRAAEVVKSLQQFVAAFKARVEGARRSSPLTNQNPGSEFSVDYESRDDAPSVAGQELNGRGRVSEHVESKGNEELGGVTAASMSGMMHAFLGRVQSQMRESVLWRRETPSQWEDTRECLERIVMHKVFDTAYGLISDTRKDEMISSRLKSLGFLTEEHLGIPKLHEQAGDGKSSWMKAEAALVDIDSMRCPGDMLQCAVRCTRMVADLLTTMRDGDVLPGADEFLPVLILLVKRGNPPRIHSNLEFIQSFRDPSKLLSESGYVLTQLVSAVCFLEEVDASLLTIGHRDFERGLAEFQETARVGLEAHQQEVKKQEANERHLHRASRGTVVAPDSTVDAGIYVTGGISSALASAPGVDAASLNGRTPGGRSNIPTSVVLPQAQPPRDIAASEVRAKRLAALRNAQTPAENPLVSWDAPDNIDIWKAARGDLPSFPDSLSQSFDSGLSDRASTTQQRGSTAYSTVPGTQTVGGGIRGRLRFAGCTASELRMSELPALLLEHQQLVQLCEELLMERERFTLRRRR